VTEPGGFYTQSGSTFTESSWTRYTGTCADEELTPGVDHSLNINQTLWEDLQPLHGISDNGLSVRVYNQYSSPVRACISLTATPSLPAVRGASTIATECLARTNPSRPIVSIPNFLYELKDLPGMLHDIGRLKQNLTRAIKQRDLKRYAANQYLAGVMGWSPLIDDLQKMLSFQDHVDKRVRELTRLYQKGGMKRTYRNKTDSASAQTNTLNRNIDSRGSASVLCNISCVRERQSWSSVRWIPTSLPKDLSNDALRRKARDLVFGLNIQPQYVWDALPWSWLIDWFGNMGDYLRSNSYVVPAKSSTVCVMHHTTTTHIVSRANPSASGTPAGGYARRTVDEKLRFVSGAALTASLPILSRRQMSILGALHVQRLRR
jgi:hypothetical protein